MDLQVFKFKDLNLVRMTVMLYKYKIAREKRVLHTCSKLLTEICEMRQILKWDLIKFCEIFTQITLELPQNSQKPSF